MSSYQSLEQAKAVALRALATRPRSIAELRHSLQRRFDEATVQKLMQNLLDSGLLDDAAFATAWRHSREQFRPRSSSMVRHELIARGVQRSVASAAVADMDDENMARRAAGKFARRLERVDQRLARHRMQAYLSRRGFSSEVVGRTIRWLAQHPAGGSLEDQRAHVQAQ